MSDAEVDACLAKIADQQQTITYQENVIRDMGTRLETDLRMLAALSRVQERWRKKGEQLRRQPLWASSSDLRQAAVLDQCAVDVADAIRADVVPS